MNILLCTNCIALLNKGNAYAEQSLYLIKMFLDIGYNIFYISCNLNINDKKEIISLNEILNGIKNNSIRSEIKNTAMDNPGLYKVKYLPFPYKKYPCSLYVKDFNKIILKHNIHKIFFLMDIQFLVGDKFMCDSYCWLPLHYDILCSQTCKSINIIDNIITLSLSSRKILLKYFPQKKITIIPHVINDKYINYIGNKYEIRKKYNIKKNIFMCLINAMNYEITNRKAIDISILGFKKYIDEHDPNAILYIKTISNSQYSIIKLIETINLPKKNYIYNDNLIELNELMDIYFMCDTTLICSKSEGFGLSIIESQILGVPVITNNFLAMYDYNIYGVCVDILQKEYNVFSGDFWIIPSIDNIKNGIVQVREIDDKYKHISQVYFKNYMSFNNVKLLIKNVLNLT